METRRSIVSLAWRALLLGASVAAAARDRTHPVQEKASPDTPARTRPPEQELEKFSPSDPKAIEVGFTLDVAQIDTSIYPRQDPGVSCGTCVNYLAKGQWGACQKHGKLVPFKGWCTLYEKKAEQTANLAK